RRSLGHGRYSERRQCRKYRAGTDQDRRAQRQTLRAEHHARSRTADGTSELSALELAGADIARVPLDDPRLMLHVVVKRLQLRKVVEHVVRDVIEYPLFEPTHHHEQLDVGHADGVAPGEWSHDLLLYVDAPGSDGSIGKRLTALPELVRVLNAKRSGD